MKVQCTPDMSMAMANGSGCYTSLICLKDVEEGKERIPHLFVLISGGLVYRSATCVPWMKATGEHEIRATRTVISATQRYTDERLDSFWEN
jgi:hypothetical protein